MICKRWRVAARAMSPGMTAMLLGAFLSACSGAKSVVDFPRPGSDNSSSPGTVQITTAMLSDTSTHSDFRYHIMPVREPGSTQQPMAVVFPADMKFSGGHVLTSTIQNDIFVNTTATAVGSPATFQANFNLSTFISVLNQYNGVSSTGKFPVGTSFSTTVPTFSKLISQDDLFNVIHAAAKVGGTGYGHEYHVFLKEGLDTCFDFGGCYSPDNPSMFTFCGYHASITYADIGHVIFSIIPFQSVAGCGDFGISGLPNPAPIDSTATTLSHETSESISDPDPNTGWFNKAFKMEIGDVCVSFRATETLNGHKYVIQPEYSNSAHGCFF